MPTGTTQRETWLMRQARARLRPAAARGCSARRRSRSARACSCWRSAAALAHPPRRGVRAPARRGRPAGRGAAAARRRADRDRRAPTRASSGRCSTSPRSSTWSPRAGAPEIATDPMGIEQSDVYIGLKPRDAWRAGPDQGRTSAREIADAGRARGARGGRRDLPADPDAHQRADRRRPLGRRPR